MHLDRDDHLDLDLQQACEVVAYHDLSPQACHPQIRQVHLLLHQHRQSLLGNLRDCDALEVRGGVILLLNHVQFRQQVVLGHTGYQGDLLLGVEQLVNLRVEVERIRRVGIPNLLLALMTMV